MNAPRVAIVMAAEEWVNRLQRHCADHGGAVVTRVILDPQTLTETDFEVLVVSANWPWLDLALVEQLHEAGRQILGVTSPSDRRGRTRLAQLGVDWMVDADQPMSGFLHAIASIAPLAIDKEPVSTSSSRTGTSIVVDGLPGVGRSELALAIAVGVARLGLPATLLDLDGNAPSLAARLNIPMEPNIHDLLTAADPSMVACPTVEGVTMVPGFIRPAVAQLHPVAAVLTGISNLLTQGTVGVIDIGSAPQHSSRAWEEYHAIRAALLERAQSVVVVGEGSPVGLTRLVTWLADLRQQHQSSAPYVVMNRAPKDAYRRDAILRELHEYVPTLQVEVIATDQRVHDSSWRGEVVHRRPFTAAAERIARMSCQSRLGIETVRSSAENELAEVGAMAVAG